ncbi:MAG: hypothetical protein H7Y38_16505, partial [Armatimonadetes bacterium]|nr:hypothetical protein [Armatimonadota bacterium]
MLRFLILLFCFTLTARANGTVSVARPSPPPGSVFLFAPRIGGAKIACFRLDTRTGKLAALPDTLLPGQNAKRSLQIVRHPGGQYIYAFAPFDESLDMSEHPTQMPWYVNRTTTVVSVLRINNRTGALTLLQTLAVPAVLGQITPHPSGRYLLGVGGDNVLLTIGVAQNGRLHLKNRSTDKRTFAMDFSGYITAEYYDWRFAPGGDYLYALVGGWHKDAGSSIGLDRYRVGKNGNLTRFGAEWFRGRVEAELGGDNDFGRVVPRYPVSRDPGSVVAWTRTGKTALLRTRQGAVRVCHVLRGGASLAAASPPQFLLAPRADTGRSSRGFDTPATVAPVGKRDVLYIYDAGYCDTPYETYREVSGGRLRRVQTFRGAATRYSNSRQLIAEPTGRLLLEIRYGRVRDKNNPDNGDSLHVRLSVLRLRKNEPPVLIRGWQELSQTAGWGVVFAEPA